MKIFDCSNLSNYPAHRGFGGPVVNDVVRQLKLHSSEYHCKWIDNPEKADILFTNDVFGDFINFKNKLKVKRMDGSFWQKGLLQRNIPFDEAAKQADVVVYISKYSQLSHQERCDIPKKYVIAINSASPIEYPRKKYYEKQPKKFVAIATDWAREEKRGASLIPVASFVNELIVIGSFPNWLKANNITKVGYKSSQYISEVLKECDCLVNLSYLDAAPKVVCQAAAIGIPILYANSGGTSEIVGAGIPIEDPNVSKFDCTQTPFIPIEKIKEGIEKIKENWEDLILKAKNFDAQKQYQIMIEKYYRNGFGL